MRARGSTAASVLVLVVITGAASADQKYNDPPAPIAQILDAPPTPSVSVSPDSQWMLFVQSRGMPSIAELSQPFVGLAGHRINPRVNGPRGLPRGKAMWLRAVGADTERKIELPENARIAGGSWSADSRFVAFTVTSADAIALWVADVATGKARELVKPLNAVTGPGFTWVAGSSALLCKLVPAGRGKPPAAPEVPPGPIVQESEGRPAPTRTFQDLLKSPADEALFEHYFTSQYALVSLDGTVRNVGAPGLHAGASPSPSGEFLVVWTWHRPWSYLVGTDRFPTRVEVWDMNGKVVRQLTDLPLQEEVPIAHGAVPQGMRSASWRADAPATLVWVEALDKGDPAVKVDKRDRVFALEAPFKAEPAPWIDLEYRYGGTSWVRPDLALVRESWEETRRTRTWAIDPSKPSAPAKALFDRSSEDRYADPGSFVTTLTPRGTTVVLTTKDGASGYLTGAGASPEGDFPFLDRMEFASGKKERLWRCAAPTYESCLDVLDPDAARILTQRESPNDPPNYFLRDLAKNESTQLTQFPDPAPQLAGVKPQLLRYQREDGTDLSATLYLPPDHDKSKGPLPFFFWAYPQEFKTAEGASQVRGSSYRFSRPNRGGDHFFLLTQGYGVLDNPTMPIVGVGDRQPNDTYVQQLCASAKAAVDKLVSMGLCDPDRVAIGGHSYGAFMTANLLAHCDTFRAGIARSGAYNRTLTPFGFQREPRKFWEARDVYMQMSPFSHADKINEPLLLIHGMMDSNPGTFPVQTERMYAAVKGNGGHARYVQLPYEDHGYAARESVGHMLWETVTWLDKHVKNAPPRR